ncbi:LysR family transcriptional regulator [Ferrimonas lipolytica]|uniref:LysR family transcriptional regulator n=1 Tax=Ferrimonas lipolytica TaxID=2724191 RepID=A0A6H1UGD3_9GAMM|nr:LysR family transcriptional regulator [Ferrimonas lipolytica]QIZ77660.1 LysR family transcriptional regulator [Ferrimonas lipolytica]
MSIQNIRTFTLIAQTKCLSHAAEIMDCNTSTITRRLQALEQECEALLVSRRGKKIELTAQGIAFLPKAHNLLSQYEAAIESVSSQHKEIAGEVVIGAHQPMATLLTELVLTQLMSKYPKLKLRLVSIPPRYMSKMEGCDFTISPIIPSDETLIAKPLYKSDKYFVASNEYLAKHGHPQSPAELANHQVITSGYHIGNEAVWHWHTRNGDDGSVVVNPRINTDSIQVSAQWMLAGFGITRLPQITISRLPKDQFQILFNGDIYDTLNLYAVISSRHYVHNRTKLLINEIQQALKGAREKVATHDG